MKKIWKIRKNSEAVSPVIATILMVAITVVLAAVLYVMVMGFGGTGTQTPQGAFTAVTKISKDVYKVPFGAVSPDTKFADCKVRIDPTTGTNAVTITTFTLTGGTFTVAPTATASATGAPGIAITDLGADNKISVGDYITVTLRTPAGAGIAIDNGDWTITLIFTTTGGSICSKVFTVSGN
jgi:flagellin-like protein